MAKQGQGLADKLYWRRLAGLAVSHCFKRLEGGGYISLCHRVEIENSGGQACLRPPVSMRCGGCDSREIIRRGHDESLPESKRWQK